MCCNRQIVAREYSTEWNAQIADATLDEQWYWSVSIIMDRAKSQPDNYYSIYGGDRAERDCDDRKDVWRGLT